MIHYRRMINEIPCIKKSFSMKLEMFSFARVPVDIDKRSLRYPDNVELENENCFDSRNNF